MSSRLGDRLRAETRTLHVEAERSPFMSALLRGRMDRAGYAALLHNLAAIYAALEPALARHAAHPALAPLDMAALARSASLSKDLALLADEPASRAGLQATTVAYVDRLRDLEATRPELLLAHAYVRYLGDLSGGQLLRDIVRRSPALAPGVGTAFYEFGDGPATAALARGFRSALDQAIVDDESALVAEARLAFEWHRRLFDELAADAGITA